MSSIRYNNTKQVNFLFVIADDQSFPHAGIYQLSTFKTPIFDSLTKVGVHFTQAFAAAPQCSPSRAAILTGKNIWQLEAVLVFSFVGIVIAGIIIIANNNFL
jgi:hypothetical protein